MKKEKKEEGVVLQPTLNRILVELIQEADVYDNGIKNINAGFEPYCLVVAVGDQVKSVQPGEHALMRLNLKADVFKLKGKKYAILTEFDITAVVPESTLPDLKNHKIKKSEEPSILEA